MTHLEIAALVATYALAVTRLLKVTQPLWAKLPRWLQLTLPALLITLPQLAGAAGLVETKLDLVEAIGQAVVAVMIAAGGQAGSAAKTAAVLLFLSLSAPACAGSLETARTSGQRDRKVGAMAAPAGTPERCAELDDRHSLYGGVSATAAALAGVSGLSTIPLDDPDQRDLRTGVAAAGVGMAALAAGALFVSQQAATSWGRECASR